MFNLISINCLAAPERSAFVQRRRPILSRSTHPPVVFCGNGPHCPWRVRLRGVPQEAMAKWARPPSWSQLPLLVHDAIALLPPARPVQLPHEGLTLKLRSRCPVLIDTIEVPAASANVSDEHVDAVEDDPAPATVRDDAIPHVCDSHDDGANPPSTGCVPAGRGSGSQKQAAPRLFPPIEKLFSIQITHPKRTCGVPR